MLGWTQGLLSGVGPRPEFQIFAGHSNLLLKNLVIVFFHQIPSQKSEKHKYKRNLFHYFR